MAGRPGHDDRKPNVGVREAGAGSSRGAVRKIPPKAREGLIRAWLAILAERHPGVTWVTVTDGASAQAVDASDAARELHHSGSHDDDVPSG